VKAAWRRDSGRKVGCAQRGKTSRPRARPRKCQAKLRRAGPARVLSQVRSAHEFFANSAVGSGYEFCQKPENEFRQEPGYEFSRNQRLSSSQYPKAEDASLASFKVSDLRHSRIAKKIAASSSTFFSASPSYQRS